MGEKTTINGVEYLITYLYGDSGVIGINVNGTDYYFAKNLQGDVTAILDVTYPEPPAEGHAFYSLPNCFLTPHIAGSLVNETHRMAEYIIEEYRRFISGEKCLYEVSEKMLETMA